MRLGRQRMGMDAVQVDQPAGRQYAEWVNAYCATGSRQLPVRGLGEMLDYGHTMSYYE